MTYYTRNSTANIITRQSKHRTEAASWVNIQYKKHNNMADAWDGCEDEFRFARQMKDTCCDESGKETNPAKAAQILYQIGLIYRNRNPEKTSLIKSAGLLNAAIVRNPPNVSQIKSDLSKLCRHILEKSNANNQTADFIEKSEQVKVLITKLRNEVKKFLKTKVPRIPTLSPERNPINQCQMKTTAIQELNKLIANRYTQIMAELSQYCEQVMGKPPCQYAIVRMGSLAREEVTPYSDLWARNSPMWWHKLQILFRVFQVVFRDFPHCCFKSTGNHCTQFEHCQFEWQRV